MMNMRCNKVLYFDIFTICDNMCVWTSWVHIFGSLLCYQNLVRQCSTSREVFQVSYFPQGTRSGLTRPIESSDDDQRA